MNQVSLIGNLTRDPEVRYPQNGQNGNPFCKFTIAVNDRKKNAQTGQWEDNPSFIPVTVFGKTAENVGKFLKKGSKVGVSGKIQTGSYVNKDGQKVYTTDVIAANVEFLTPVQNAGGQAPQGAQSQQPQQQQMAAPDGFTPMADDDIPF